MMEGRTTSKENRRQRSNESGQALVVFIVFIFGLIATMGLVLDGGNIYLQRRGMQNAADAGALAGAQVLALGGTTAEAEAVARNYAEERNGAQSTDISFDDSGEEMEICVVAHITTPMTFARVIGVDELDVVARACASFDGVCTPSEFILAPIAVRNLGYLPYNPADPEGTTYYIWDDPVEEGPGEDPEGDDPLATGNIAGNNRGWVSMNCAGYPLPPNCPNVGASTLVDWMQEGYPEEFGPAPIWVRGDNGVKDRPVAITSARISDTLKIPVFGDIDPSIDYLLPAADCTGNGEAIQECFPGKTYFHIVDVKCFVVTDVIATGNPKGIKGHFLPACTGAGEPGCESDFKTFFLTE